MTRPAYRQLRHHARRSGLETRVSGTFLMLFRPFFSIVVIGVFMDCVS
jgi:hypothetical protein